MDDTAPADDVVIRLDEDRGRKWVGCEFRCRHPEMSLEVCAQTPGSAVDAAVEFMGEVMTEDGVDLRCISETDCGHPKQWITAFDDGHLDDDAGAPTLWALDGHRDHCSLDRLWLINCQAERTVVEFQYRCSDRSCERHWTHEWEEPALHLDLIMALIGGSLELRLAYSLASLAARTVASDWRLDTDGRVRCMCATHDGYRIELLGDAPAAERAAAIDSGAPQCLLRLSDRLYRLEPRARPPDDDIAVLIRLVDRARPIREQVPHALA